MYHKSYFAFFSFVLTSGYNRYMRFPSLSSIKFSSGGRGELGKNKNKNYTDFNITFRMKINYHSTSIPNVKFTATDLLHINLQFFPMHKPNYGMNDDINPIGVLSSKNKIVTQVKRLKQSLCL